MTLKQIGEKLGLLKPEGIEDFALLTAVTCFKIHVCKYEFIQQKTMHSQWNFNKPALTGNPRLQKLHRFQQKEKKEK